MRVTLFYLLLVGVILLSWRFGRIAERVAAGTCVAGTLLTVFVSAALPERFADFNIAALLVDAAVLCVFVVIAVRSSRFWPLWVAGLQLTATSIHLLTLLRPNLFGYVAGAALAAWSYPILLLLAVGCLRTQLVERWRSARLQDAF